MDESLRWIILKTSSFVSPQKETPSSKFQTVNAKKINSLFTSMEFIISLKKGETIFFIHFQMFVV